MVGLGTVLNPGRSHQEQNQALEKLRRTEPEGAITTGVQAKPDHGKASWHGDSQWPQGMG